MHTFLCINWLMHTFRYRRACPAALPLDTHAVAPYSYGYCASIQAVELWVLFGTCKYVLAASLMHHFTETVPCSLSDLTNLPRIQLVLGHMTALKHLEIHNVLGSVLLNSKNLVRETKASGGYPPFPTPCMKP